MIGVDDDDDDDDEGYFLVPSRWSVSAWGKTTAHRANQERDKNFDEQDESERKTEGRLFEGILIPKRTRGGKAQNRKK